MTKSTRNQPTGAVAREHAPGRGSVAKSRSKAAYELGVEYAAGTAVVGESVGRLVVTERGLSFSVAPSVLKSLNAKH